MGGATAGEAFASRQWGVAYRLLSEVPREDLTVTDLDRLAVAAYLIGEDDQAVAAWEQAHNCHLNAGDGAEAARCAFWAGFCLITRGQMAHAGAWLRRAETAIGPDADCPARGYLMIPALLHALGSGDGAAALKIAAQVGEVAERFRDTDLATVSTVGHGQALLAMGDEAGGVAWLDDAMLAVTSGEVGPILSGIVYCAVIDECMKVLDLARAAEWTTDLDEWCRAQPDLVPFRGQCLVHKSQLRQAAGDWRGAVKAVADARDRLSDPPHPALGLAWYQEAELLRLCGDADGAADAYRLASAAGYEPMPGLALLQLQRGDVGSAAVSIGRALGEASHPFQRPALLAAGVEIYIAAGDLSAAADSAAELMSIAGRTASAAVRAMAAHATGAALLASGETNEALTHLRTSARLWQELNVPYEAARTAVLIGQACTELGDSLSAALEIDKARLTFESLGARSDLARVVGRGGEAPGQGTLSARELQVLGLVAGGKTSREIASELTISQHTVRRHLENIFAKLRVNSRPAAIARAYELELL